MSSGFIPKEKLSAYERWELAAFDEDTASEGGSSGRAHQTPSDSAKGNAVQLPTAEEIERIYNEAHDTGLIAGKEAGHAEGYAAGHAEGFAAGHGEGVETGRTAGYQEGLAEAAAEADRLRALGDNLRQNLNTLDQEIAEELLAVAVEIASQVLRRTLQLRPELLLPVIREAVAALPLHHGHPALYLNPDDANLVRTHLGEQLAHNGWRIIEDSNITVGGCRIESGASEVDATLETRWRRALDAIGIDGDWLQQKP